jgi:RecA/RadA recombinase
MADFFKDIAKLVGDDIVKVAEDGTIADNTALIDTGCYTLNLALSGSLFGGAPTNKVVGFAALEAVGKSYLIIQIVRNFLGANAKGRVIYNDTEGRIDKQMLESRGVDVSRVLMLYPESIEQFRNVNHQILVNYRARDEKDKFPLLMVADSLTQLPSVKETADAAADKDAGDMGMRAKAWRSAFRVLRQPLSKAKVAMFCTNHTYQSTGMFPTTEVAGGGGFKYAADIILLLAKRKDADSEKVVRGNILHMKVAKGWNVKQHSELRAYLSYSKGLDRYFGLQDLAIESGVIRKDGTRLVMPDGAKIFEKELLAHPEKYYTQEVLEKVEEFAKKRFCFSDDDGETLGELIGDKEEVD